MMKYFTLAACCSLCILSGCLKDGIPDEVSVDPVFWVNYQVGQVSYADTAGLYEKYMFTRHIADDTIRDRRIGSMAYANCPDLNCPGTLTFALTQPVFVTDSAFTSDLYPLFWVDAPDVLFNLGLIANDAPAGTKYNWFLNDTLVSNESFVQLSNISAPIVNIRLVTTDTGGYFSETNRALASDAGTDQCLVADILSTPVGPDSVELNAVVTGLHSGQLKYTWSTGETDSKIVLSPKPGDQYALTVTDSGFGCAVSARISTKTGWHQKFSTTNLRLFSSGKTFPLLQNSIAIEWVDSQGVPWRSDWGPQPGDSRFQLLGWEPYNKNENGIPTRKMHIQYVARLFNPEGLQKTITGEGVIAVAWP